MDTRGQRGVKSLLLMYLLVVKAAGDCPKPEGGTNTVLTNKSLLMNDFPENVEVTLECSNGYIKESGSEVITCIDNKWTTSDLVCKRRDCGQPPPQPHMSFDTSSGTLFGAVISVTCDKGYLVTGSSYKQCYASGWSGRAVCEIVECDTPPEIANGRAWWDFEALPVFETTILYTCNDGYSFIGNDTIVCTETGEYSSPPECKEVRTTVPAPTSQTQAAQTATEPPSPAAPTVHRAKTNTTSTTPALSASPQGSLSAEEKAATTTVTSTTSSSFQDMDDDAVATGDHIVLIAVSAIVLPLGVIILCYICYKFSLRRKGSSGIAPI